MWSGEKYLWETIEETAKMRQAKVKRIPPSALLTLVPHWPSGNVCAVPSGIFVSVYRPCIPHLFTECILLLALTKIPPPHFSSSTEHPWTGLLVIPLDPESAHLQAISSHLPATSLLLWGPCNPALSHLSGFTYSPLLNFQHMTFSWKFFGNSHLDAKSNGFHILM